MYTYNIVKKIYRDSQQHVKWAMDAKGQIV